MEKFLFFFFSILSLVCGLFVVTSRNPIHSVLFLVLVFFNVSGLLILLGVEFLALLFLIVYVGAIAVLFLFIIMMLDIKSINSSQYLKDFLFSYDFLLIGLIISQILLFLNFSDVKFNNNESIESLSNEIS